MKTISKIAVMFILFFSSNAFAQTRQTHEVYAMMMFNITKYVQWPGSGTGDFVIGVVGNDDIYTTLTSWYDGKPKGTQTYRIKSVKTVADAQNCSVVFIDKSKSSQFDAFKEMAKGKGVLIITDNNGLGAKGSNINFTTVDNKLKFELNQKAFEASNLKVSGSLSAMAILI